METFLSGSWYPSSLSFANSQLQSMNEGYNSMPSSLLVQEQGLDPSFTPSSPSLDMEAALEHLSSSHDSELSSSRDLELSSSPNSTDVLDVLMVDPFLDYLNEVLMEEEEGQENVPYMQHDVEASYHAIVSSLYDIIGGLPRDSAPSEHMSSTDLSDEYAWDKSSHDELRAEITESYGRKHKSPTREIHISETSGKSPGASGDINVSLKEKKIATSFVKQKTVLNFCSQAHIAPSEFKDNTGYADLYVGKPSVLDNSTSSTRARSLNGNKKKSLRGARKGSQSTRNVSAEVVGLVDLRELLVSCAQAVAIGDVRKASEIMQELYQVHGASAKGNSLQRVVHYFCEALLARMGGIGAQQYRSMIENMPSVMSFLRASRIWYGVAPYLRLMHYFANQNILKAAKGASRLHILDYGIFDGMQWPSLINALADCEGGPPLLVITGIDCPMPGQNSLEWLEEHGRRLEAYAKTYKVPFEFHAIVSNQWEDIDPASLHIQKSEVLVINCLKRLRHHADESIDLTVTISPRQKLLMSMRSLNPHLLLIAELNSASSSSFFVSRFREALYFFSSTIDMLDTVCGDNPDRLFIETRAWARDILNIVGCEGAERVERPETYRQWDLRIKRAGFELLPIPSVILSRSRSYVKQQCHKDFMVDDDADGWMLLGWKGRTLLTVSAWKPTHM